ncbi:pyruvate kinase [Roseiconus nitratireducens]|uniref:pyruvate kinase n=1 Tax=Roseiconus nitratireducens TaxID=2605748 RepID=A0A5M6CZ94_9BACT|nr:pyruvate kinase [Roseiconus nitratireducens]KAA5539332.1 pyruvate kinase [Roseiconus nitratireducens]
MVNNQLGRLFRISNFPTPMNASNIDPEEALFDAGGSPTDLSSQAELSSSLDDGDELGQRLQDIRRDMAALQAKAEPLLRSLPPRRRLSGANLLHYVALRRHDIRDLQEQLVVRGLSSLGRCERSVKANLDAVLRILGRPPAVNATADKAEGKAVDKADGSEMGGGISFSAGRELLRVNTERLFGGNADREPAIMVTMPPEAAVDRTLVRELLEAGMTVMRINCAHDEPSTWSAMIANLRSAEASVGRRCRVAMDLGGPKIRTGPIVEGPRVLKWKPQRSDFGIVVQPARLWMTPNAAAQPQPDCDVVVPVTGEWWKAAQPGDRLRFTDAAGRKRTLSVLHVDENGMLAEARKTAYVTDQTRVEIQSSAVGDDGTATVDGTLGPLPPRSTRLVLHVDDVLLITEPALAGRPASRDRDGRLSEPATIGCTLPEVFASVRAGHRVLLDDGKIAGVVEQANDRQLRVKITRAREKGQRLGEDKGINFPDTDLQLPALTETDLNDLSFIAEHADLVNFSFVRGPDDVRQLRRHLERLGRIDLGIILKIENRQAFETLPRLLLEVMHSDQAGVMIARGDLAVECGWERLVEVQEEILWMSEAAHLPVVWATQVLEGSAKEGLPSRAELTDAGVAARAECVMLNKGPHIVDTVRRLHDILERMQQHQEKKRPTFRRLHIADRLFVEAMT